MRQIFLRILKGVGIVVALLLWLAAGIGLYGRFHARFLAAISRPATSAEMEDIVAAALPDIETPVARRTQGCRFSVTIAGHDPSAALLKRVADGCTAIPGSQVHSLSPAKPWPKNVDFKIVAKPFAVLPWGTAIGTIGNSFGDLGCEVRDVHMQRRSGAWHVSSARLTLEC